MLADLVFLQGQDRGLATADPFGAPEPPSSHSPIQRTSNAPPQNAAHVGATQSSAIPPDAVVAPVGRQSAEDIARGLGLAPAQAFLVERIMKQWQRPTNPPRWEDATVETQAVHSANLCRIAKTAVSGSPDWSGEEAITAADGVIKGMRVVKRAMGMRRGIIQAYKGVSAYGRSTSLTPHGHLGALIIEEGIKAHGSSMHTVRQVQDAITLGIKREQARNPQSSRAARDEVTYSIRMACLLAQVYPI